MIAVSWQGVLLGSGGAQDESDNEFNAADRDRDGVITYVARIALAADH